MLGCIHAVLFAGVNTQWTNVHGLDQRAVELIRQHTAPPPQPAAATPAAPPDAGEPAVSSPAPLPADIFKSAGHGELQKVVKWLRKGGPVDALCPTPSPDGQTTAVGLLHIAAANGQLEMVRVLLKRGASVDLQGSLGTTALMNAAYRGHLSILLFLLHHSANPNLQSGDSFTALMMAAGEGQEACVQALLRVKANTQLLDKDGRTALWWAEEKGHTATAKLIRQHAAPPQPAATLAAPLDTGEPAVSSPASLPDEIFGLARRGELQKVVKWLRKGGLIDALCPTTTSDGRATAFGLLHAAAGWGRLEMARELLKRGASVDLPSGLGVTALMEAANHGHLSILLFLLHHSANPDLQATNGGTALMHAAQQGQTACVQALLRAKANTELLDESGHTALQSAEYKGHTATAKLFRQHASCRSLGLSLELCALMPFAWPWGVLSAVLVLHSVVLGAIAMVAFSRTLRAGPGQHRVARQRHAKAHGRTNTAETTRQHAAPLQVARADAAMEKLLAEEAEQAKEQARSKKSKKKSKAGRAAAAGDEPSEAPPAPAPALPLAATPEPTVSAAERAEAALRAAIAGGGLSALEAALAVAPREVREGGVGAEARALCGRLLEAQQETEREAKQEAAVETARLAAAERAREGVAREAERVAAASEARVVAVAAAVALVAAAKAAAAAEAEADALERATVDVSEGGSSGAAGPSEASEAEEVPDAYICPITAEIMTDPVTTADGFTYERTAISEWLRTKDTSPFTGATLESKTVIPNLSLRSMIRGFSEASTAR